MKQFFLAIFILLFGSQLVFSQSNLFFNGYNVKSMSAFSAGGRLSRMADSSYLMSCIRSNGNNGPDGISLTKLNKSGSVLWAKEIHYNTPERSNNGTACSDGGYLSVTYFVDTSNNRDVINVLKLDENGDMLWNRQFRDTISSYQFTVAEIDNYCYAAFSGKVNGWKAIDLVKLNQNGFLTWSNTYYFPYDLNVEAFAVNSSNNLVLVGHFYAPGIGKGVNILEVDASGNIISCYRYQGELDLVRGCFFDNENNLVILGTNGTLYGYFMKLSPVGNLVFCKSVEFGIDFDELWDAVELDDGSYLVLAEPESFTGVSQAGLLKFTNDGTYQWMKIYGDTTGSFPTNMLLNDDSTVTIGGILGDFATPSDFYLLKVGIDGSASCNVQDVTAQIADIPLTVGYTCSQEPITAGYNYEFTINDEQVIGYDECTNIPLEVIDLSYAASTPPLVPSVISIGDNPGWHLLHELPVINLSVQVFDLIGQPVYSSTDPDFNWNGEHQSAGSVNGIYLWRISYILSNGSQIVNTGKVLLVPGQSP